MPLNKETTLLLLLSRVKPGKSALVRAQALIDAGIDWDFLIKESARHGTANLIYRNLSGLERIPETAAGRLNRLYNFTLRGNIRLAAETERLMDGLSAGGLDAIVLKGPVTSEAVFGDIGIYPSGDIDFLIKVRDIDAAREYFESVGYSLNDAGFDSHRDFYIRELNHMSLSNAMYTIEPHWNLFFRYFTAPPEFWWEETISAESDSRRYRWLSPEKNLLYNAFRTYFKLFDQLRFLVLFSELIRHHQNEIDWQKLFSHAKLYRFESVLRVMLKLAHDLLGAAVPEEYTELKQLRQRMLYPRVRRMALEGDKSHALNKVLLASLRDDFSGFLRVMGRRLFPSMGEIISRYRLTGISGKAIGFYVLNPVLVLMQMHQKK
jgi:hypothetical protein